MAYRLGVDVGGTFTDVLLIDEASGVTQRARTPSTPADQSVGVLEGVRKVCAEAGTEGSEVAHFLHGTTVATNAILEGKGARVGLYVRPIVRRYLESLERQLRSGGVASSLHVLRSDGGLASISTAEVAPVNLLMSGPAGGVAGALWAAGQAGYDNLLTFVMGGTSTDVALVDAGRPRIGRETNVGDLTVPARPVDMRTVGAGGGSIAHVPEPPS